jgi:SPP1 family predicted phage head-tail adaptor
MAVIGDIGFILSRIGKSVELQSKTVVQGGYTGDTVTWAKTADITVALENLQGRELEEAQKLGIEAQFKAYTKYTNVNEKQRIKYNSRYFYITYVSNPVQLSDFVIVYLTESDTYGSQSNQ